MTTVAIAGASGFIGSHLVKRILNETDWSVQAMSRGEKKSDHPRLRWIKADLFSVLDIERGIEGADIAVYLVHSMQPSAHLDQASFVDYDLILADNFGRACKSCSVKQVLYLGGLVPKRGDLSRHLASRLEVEKVFKEYIPQFTFFRAAMVLGKGGSSFHILVNLVNRLPILLCPGWTELPTSPVHVDKVSETFLAAMLKPAHYGKVYDLTSKNEMSYLELLKNTARLLGKKRIFITIKFYFIGPSRLWVALVSGAPKRLAYPLVNSLKNEMVAAPDKKFPEDEVKLETVEEGLSKAIKESQGFTYKFQTREADRKTVRSVQRSPLPKDMNAEDVAKEFLAWLPKALWPFLVVKITGGYADFYLLGIKARLMSLRWSPERSDPDRQLFYIAGGILAAPQDRGRLEFREVLGRKWMLAAVHDFCPALPWYIYIFSQALVHLSVMKLFGRHLRLLAEGKREWIQRS